DFHLGVADQLHDVVGHGYAGGIALRVGVARRDLDDLDATTGAPSNLLGVALEHVEGAATDGPQSTDTYFHRFHAKLPISAACPAGAGHEKKSRTLRRARLLVNQPAQSLLLPAASPPGKAPTRLSVPAGRPGPGRRPADSRE